MCSADHTQQTQHAAAHRVAGVTIGDLRADELPLLSWSGSPSHIEHVARQLERREAGVVDYLVVRDANGVPIAKGAVDYEERAGAGTIFQLATREDLQGRGFATMIIAAAEERITARGISLARLAVEPDNERALRLYERLGYRAAGERETGWEYQRPDGARDFYRTRVIDMEKALGSDR